MIVTLVAVSHKIFCQGLHRPANVKVVFGSGKKKNVKENDFFMFGYPMKNIKENKI